jgi:formylglycine-generating enzyme required for sulfatase activity
VARLRIFIISGACALPVGCSLFVDTSDLNDGAENSDTSFVDGAALDASTDGNSPSDGQPNDAGKICPSGIGPTMVLVPGNGTTPSFCIDSTDVTSAQYIPFLTNGPALSTLPAVCSYKSQYSTLSTSGDYPANVDWCDAYAFCEYAGKRLCGKIGGGSNDFGDFANVAKSQWYYACTAGGARVYPYGNAYDGTLCDDYEYDAGGDIPVASDSKCVGGFPGIYDMAGNVWEWEDSCTPGDSGSSAGDACRLRGGTYVDSASILQCDFDYLDHFQPTRNTSGSSFIGFRCCAD